MTTKLLAASVPVKIEIRGTDGGDGDGTYKIRGLTRITIINPLEKGEKRICVTDGAEIIIEAL